MDHYLHIKYKINVYARIQLQKSPAISQTERNETPQKPSEAIQFKYKADAQLQGESFVPWKNYFVIQAVQQAIKYLIF